MIIRLLLSFATRSVTFACATNAFFRPSSFFSISFYDLPSHFFIALSQFLTSEKVCVVCLERFQKWFVIAFFLQLRESDRPPDIVLKEELELKLYFQAHIKLYSFFPHCRIGQLNVILGFFLEFLSKDSLLMLGPWPHFLLALITGIQFGIGWLFAHSLCFSLYFYLAISNIYLVS